ncbi:hypothetical protein C449_17392 [Halococcus saccharolyticus DSM 5350]|uniref:Uncharacterized protein n=1 Tax=Halococcus saccharolyticus DSM 5350 TaxID=1227455 RepID=M0MD07_9EURY|nr:hypothetical protein C449_17392 [Halococcus saccharolyticus DSM 5350]
MEMAGNGFIHETKGGRSLPARLPRNRLDCDPAVGFESRRQVSSNQPDTSVAARERLTDPSVANTMTSIV